MQKWLPLTFLALALPGTALACEYPERVNVPDGRSASLEEMQTGQKDVKTYMAAMEEYLDCIDKEADDNAADAEDEEMQKQQRAILVQKHNAAVDEMEQVAESFNVQVRAYKEANP